MHPQSSARQFISPANLLRSGEVTARYKVLTANVDLLDRLVDVPMTQQECGQVLSYYMQHVFAASPVANLGQAQDEMDLLANARRELSALLQHDLDPIYFRDAAKAGWQLHCRRVGYPLADGYEMWSDAELIAELAWCVDCLIEGIER